MKRIKDLRKFVLGKKYLFVFKTETTVGKLIRQPRSTGGEDFPIFKIYTTSSKRKFRDGEGYLSQDNLDMGKAYLLTENEFRVYIL
jgi:hypothetical protein